MGPRELLARAKALATAALILVPAVAVTAGTQPIAASASSSRLIPAAGTSTFSSAPLGPDALGKPELMSGARADGAAGSFSGTVNPRGKIDGAGGGENNLSARLKASFDGLNHRQQRLANQGNQFSLEPPDQGLCVGNGFVMEAINDVTRVYDRSGNPLTGVIALNTFFKYLPAINRTTGVRGPFITDPSCLYDKATQRWFLVVLTLDVDPGTGANTGTNHLDIAVSQTADPTAPWTIYQMPVQDDGTQGTPDHGCSLNPDGSGHGPCFGDYPHIGADRNGFYITTNEYSFFGPEFKAAQIYAFSKSGLESGSGVTATQFNTIGMDNGNGGFTIWPATSPSGSGSGGEGGGTEYFLSSNAADEAHVPDFSHPGPGMSNQLLVWAVTNTRSLNSTPDLTLSHTVVGVDTYAIPPASDQKPGDTPLVTCFNTAPCATLLLGGPDPYTEVMGKLDSNDTRMQQVTFTGDYLVGALDTALTMGDKTTAGIEYFVVKPGIEEGSVTAHLSRDGYFGVAGNNTNYPAIGLNSDGHGVMAFTLVGPDYYPSSAYTTFDVENGAGALRIAAAGAGPQDGFTETKVESPFGNGVPRPRWGDYGAAVPDGNSVWIASEYIGQTCTYAQYISAPFGSCGGTRTALANWDTRISRVAIEN